jgi:hypothetical protein
MLLILKPIVIFNFFGEVGSLQSKTRYKEFLPIRVQPYQRNKEHLAVSGQQWMLLIESQSRAIPEIHAASHRLPESHGLLLLQILGTLDTGSISANLSSLPRVLTSKS